MIYVMDMTRIHREDWFRIAAEQLLRHGAGGLTLARLTEAAGVTQGSYYHHFGGQGGFKQAFLEHLEGRAFVELAFPEGPEPLTPEQGREALRRLVALIASEDLALEAAVRQWASSDPQVAELVDRVDTRRAGLIYRLFLAVVGEPERAAYLARLNGAFYLGAVTSRPPIEGAEYARMAGDLERLLDLPAREESA